MNSLAHLFWSPPDWREFGNIPSTLHPFWPRCPCILGRRKTDPWSRAGALQNYFLTLVPIQNSCQRSMVSAISANCRRILLSRVWMAIFRLYADPMIHKTCIQLKRGTEFILSLHIFSISAQFGGEVRREGGPPILGEWFKEIKRFSQC